MELVAVSDSFIKPWDVSVSESDRGFVLECFNKVYISIECMVHIFSK